MPGNKYLSQKDVPLKYALIGDTLLPMPPSLEVFDEDKADEFKNGTVEIDLDKDFDRGSVEYSYMCGDGANKHIDLTTAKRTFDELDKGSTQRYVRFKGRKALISDFKSSHGDKNTEDHNLVFDYNGKQYYLFMSTFAPTEAARAYSYGMWKKLSDGIILLEKDKGKIECSVNKISIGDSEVRFEFTVTNKSDKTVKVSVPTIAQAFFNIKLNGRSLFNLKKFRDIGLPELFPYSSKEYLTLKAKEKGTSENKKKTSSQLDTKYLNSELIESLRKSSNPITLNYEYKADVVFMRGTSKALSVQTTASKGVVMATYPDN
jgi:hypothetical protein